VAENAGSLEGVQRVLDKINEKFGDIGPLILVLIAVVIYLYLLKYFLTEALNVL
jgi:hypothetical protein